MSVIFLHPPFLFLIAVLPLLWVMARRPVDMGQVLLRGILLLLVILALAKPVIFDAGTNKHHIFIVDLTDSLSTEQKQEAVEALDSLIGQVKAGDRHTTLVMGGVAGIRDEPGFKDAVYLSPSNRSSLSAALKEAVESIPIGGRGAVSLLTDGRATDQNWADALRAIQDRKIPVHILDLAQAQDDIFISGLTVDGDLREGQTSTVFVEISGSGEGLRVEIYADDQLWAASGEFDNEGTRQIALNVEPKRQGFVSIEAKLIVPAAALDKDKSNNNLNDLVAIAPPLRLLYLGERQRRGAEKLQGLLGAGFAVSEEQDRPLDETFPINTYDLVVIDDRPAKALPEAFQTLLKQAVRENGLGVFFAGGRSAFGEGGYKGSEIEKMLPVEFRQRDEKKDPSVSLAIVIDTSGSMAGRPIELAKHVAKLAVGRLKPHDMVGVVEFYGNRQWAVPLQSAANKIEIDRAISRMQSGGATNLYPAVEEAYYGLKNMNTRFKHLLILIDGDMGGDQYEGIVRRMAKDGITVSTVLAGYSLHHQDMFDVASWGRGRFYTVGNRFSLVDIILKREQTTKLPAYHPGQHKIASRTGPGWIGDIEPLPDVRGYVETKMKPAGELLLEIDGKKHPLLASWRYGLGRVTSLMSEPFGSGTSSWQDWPEYGAFLGRILSRTASDMDVFAYDIARAEFSVTVTARRMGRDRDIVPAAWMLDEVAVPDELTFLQRSPDLYEANLQIPHGQLVRVEAVSRHTDKPINYEKTSRKYRLASAAYDGITPERQVSPNGLDMGRLRMLSGGEVLDRGNPVLSPSVSKNDDRSLSVKNIWPYLLLLAILVYLLELFYRRWPGLTFRGNG